ncbi:DUF2378 family protein [Aggregicoccus sp. 17bor-14]|uniref:DUF2378 family protein n=1 Tax=Myxococcaceae TaxID=31 RepID=UPI00129C6C29|nr:MULTISPECIES: DUF2378 family protein [Myxococcaceae]MBF5045450.1 DUF2378 family protein [Simulacricoccus sp. 17bor-14]MRI91190.1 DUF2378 family protein [Aggregicoccus sp. 17bor-14]
MSTPLPAESVTRGTAFEGMFVRALQPTGRFAEQLRAAGYDPAQPARADYPTRVWQACLDVARQHTFPQLSRAAGEHRLGQLFIEGFFQTLAGKMLGATLPMLGPDTVMQKLKRAWASSQPNVEVTPVQLGERHWSVTLRERGILADFCGGLIAGILLRTRVQPEVTVTERAETHCVLSVRWTAKP